jgi:dsRNA-specific ribonuclease
MIDTNIKENGIGKSKKQAEQNAAKKLLERLTKKCQIL